MLVTSETQSLSSAIYSCDTLAQRLMEAFDRLLLDDDRTSALDRQPLVREVKIANRPRHSAGTATDFKLLSSCRLEGDNDDNDAAWVRAIKSPCTTTTLPLPDKSISASDKEKSVSRKRQAETSPQEAVVGCQVPTLKQSKHVSVHRSYFHAQ